MHKYTRPLGWCVLLALPLGCLAPLSGPSLDPTALEELTLSAPYIFEAIILEAGGSTVRNLSSREHTAVVTVTAELKVPAGLGNYVERNITVLLAYPVSTGERFVFFAEGAVFGQGLVVRELARIGSDDKLHRNLATELIHDLPGRLFREHVRAAELIVVGRVASILGPPPEDAPQPISEHDPIWRLARIEVQSVEAGTYLKPTLLVPFATSNDVMWWDRPRFATGQEGIWILHSTASEPERTTLFEATDGSDFLPLESLEFVRHQIAQLAQVASTKEDSR